MRSAVTGKKIHGDELLVARGQKRHPNVMQMMAQWEADEAQTTTVVAPTTSTITVEAAGTAATVTQKSLF